MEQRAIADEQARVLAIKKARGRSAYWCLNIDTGDFLNECQPDGDTACIAFIGTGVICINDDGVHWYCSIPRVMRNKLVGRAKTLPKPAYVAGGSYDRWYIRFADNSIRLGEWNGDERFRARVCDDAAQCKYPKIVAFGEDIESYFVLYDDGTYDYYGIPTVVHNKLRSRNPRLPKLNYIALGPENQWFLRWEDGKREWGGPTSHNFVSKYHELNVKRVYFGNDNEYLFMNE